MYQFNENEVNDLLTKIKSIRQQSGELLAALEHMMQLQKYQKYRTVHYDPDDYLRNETGRETPFYPEQKKNILPYSPDRSLGHDNDVRQLEEWNTMPHGTHGPEESHD